MNRVPWRLARHLSTRRVATCSSGSFSSKQPSYSYPRQFTSRTAGPRSWTKQQCIPNVYQTSHAASPRSERSFSAAAAAGSDSSTATEPITPQSQPAADLKAPEHLSEGELHVFEKLKEAFSPSKLDVRDVSGGCGSMYSIEIDSAEFRGLSVIKQHRKVQEVLAEEIKGWHGVQVRTKVS